MLQQSIPPQWSDIYVPPNLVKESGFHSAVYPNCHNQIAYAKFNLKVHYPPHYESVARHYEQGNVDHIRKDVNLYPREKANSEIWT